MGHAADVRQQVGTHEVLCRPGDEVEARLVRLDVVPPRVRTVLGADAVAELA
jgi:hypothetical protein